MTATDLEMPSTPDTSLGHFMIGVHPALIAGMFHPEQMHVKDAALCNKRFSAERTTIPPRSPACPRG
jgi:hypothetical protein